jgi:serine/threonine-protein kinase
VRGTVVLPDSASHGEVVARFIREGRAAVKIRSEHVARIFDVGKLENGLPYMAMEYLEGTDLAGLVAERGALPVSVAVDFVLQACEAVAEAHALGMVHRDLKPGNILFDADGRACVADFGLAKLDTQSTAGLTHSRTMLGTPHYLAPELAAKAGTTATIATDVYALGAILYELLAGHPPFQSETLAGLLRRY